MHIVAKLSLYFVFLLSFPQKGHFGSSLTLIGQIADDSKFYYREFLTFPSLMATIKYYIKYNYTATELQCPLCVPSLDIYTTKSYANLDRNCSVNVFGQLRNENLHTPLKPKGKLYRFTNCTADSYGIVHCYGETKIQDYIPRTYGFSFGYRCRPYDEKRANRSLKGLQYNMTIYGQTNKTQCSSMAMAETGFSDEIRICSRLYSHMSLPNLVGNPDWNHLRDKVLSAAQYAELLMKMSPHEKCYPYVYELACYVIVPKCEPENRTVIHPCKEMCEELRAGCQENVLAVLKVIAAKQNFFDWIDLSRRDPSTWFDCNYLPSRNGTIPCIYKPVACQPPPNVTNAVSSTGNGIYQAPSTVNYSCESDKFHLEGNSTITCKYSGEWSKLPQCVPNTVTPLVIVLPLLISPLIMLAVILIRYRCLGKLELRRNREFDAFVCYNFDTDCEYVLNTILPEMGENHDPPFKLCFDSKDFTPGVHIKENIIGAIRSSNSAIIVLSQGFVDSIWCKEEFADCYIENMKDPAFRLFVILMEPVENLENVSEYMKSFFEKKTYLLRDDPQLFQKIREYLVWVKKSEHGKNNHDEEKEDAPEIDQLL